MVEISFPIGVPTLVKVLPRAYRSALSVNDLRRDPAVGAGDAGLARERRLSRLQLLAQAEIADHGAHLRLGGNVGGVREEHVVRLDIAMHDIQRVQMLQSGRRLAQRLCRADLVVQNALLCILLSGRMFRLLSRVMEDFGSLSSRICATHLQRSRA